MRIVKKPGVTPPILFHLIGNTGCLWRRDMARHLPVYQERVQLIPLNEVPDPDAPTQARCYCRLTADLHPAVQRALRAGSTQLLGTYLQALLASPSPSPDAVAQPRRGDTATRRRGAQVAG